MDDTQKDLKGGPGSGYFNHAGRPGLVGGSAPDNEIVAKDKAAGVVYVMSSDGVEIRRPDEWSKLEPSGPLRNGSNRVIVSPDGVMLRNTRGYKYHTQMYARQMFEHPELYTAVELGYARDAIRYNRLEDTLVENAVQTKEKFISLEYNSTDGDQGLVAVSADTKNKTTSGNITTLYKNVMRLVKRGDIEIDYTRKYDYAIFVHNGIQVNVPMMQVDSVNYFRFFIEGDNSTLVDTVFKSIKGGPGSGHFDHAGRPGEVGGSAPSSQTFLGKIPNSEIGANESLSGIFKIYKIEDNFMKDYEVGLISLDGKHLYVADNNGRASHITMLHVIKDTLGKDAEFGYGKVLPDGQNTLDDYVHFYIEDNQIIASPFYAGLVINNQDDNDRAVDNIFDAADALVRFGLPSDTKLTIRRTSYNSVMYITVKMLNIKGGSGSGYFGHAGRPGKVGGSAPMTGQPFTATMYHGWSDKQTDAGDFGKGEYWSTSRSVAASYGDVEKRTIRLHNPKVIIGTLDALDLVNKYGTVNGKDREKAAAQLTKDLMKEGFDGIVIQGWDGPPGSYTAVIFSGDPNPVVGKLHNQRDVFRIVDASTVLKYGAIVVSLTDDEVLAARDNEWHNDVIQAVHPEKTVDDYVRFVAFKETYLESADFQAGLVIQDEDDSSRAVDRIYKALDKLVRLGLPKNTPVAISVDKVTIRTTAKSILVYLAIKNVKNILSAIANATKGGAGSGHFGHAGRPGKVGGSASGGRIKNENNPVIGGFGEAEYYGAYAQIYEIHDASNLLEYDIVVVPVAGGQILAADTDSATHNEMIQRVNKGASIDDYVRLYTMDNGLIFNTQYAGVPIYGEDDLTTALDNIDIAIRRLVRRGLPPETKIRILDINLDGDVLNTTAKSLQIKGGPGSGHHGHAGRPGEVGGSRKDNELLGETSYMQTPVYMIHNATDLVQEFNMITVAIDKEIILAAKSDQLIHYDLIRMVRGHDDDYVRFFVYNEVLKTSIDSAGVIISSNEDREKAIDNISMAMAKLRKIGLPQKTPLVIRGLHRELPYTKSIAIPLELKTFEHFKRVIRGLVLDLYQYPASIHAFVDDMVDIINQQLRKAWNEGMRENALVPAEDMTPEFENILQDIILREFNYVDDFAVAIVNASGNKDALPGLYARADAWANRYNDVVNRAIIETAGAKDKYIWEYGDTEHCNTCLKLHGCVATVKEWEASPYHPQQPPNENLECGGWKCKCKLSPTRLRKSYGGIEAYLERQGRDAR